MQELIGFRSYVPALAIGIFMAICPAVSTAQCTIDTVIIDIYSTLYNREPLFHKDIDSMVEFGSHGIHAVDVYEDGVIVRRLSDEDDDRYPLATFNYNNGRLAYIEANRGAYTWNFTYDGNTVTRLEKRSGYSQDAFNIEHIDGGYILWSEPDSSKTRRVILDSVPRGEFQQLGNIDFLEWDLSINSTDHYTASINHFYSVLQEDRYWKIEEDHCGNVTRAANIWKADHSIWAVTTKRYVYKE